MAPIDVMGNEAAGTSDRALIELVVSRGCEGSFRTLYRRHTPAIYGFALRMMDGSTLDAEDAVQETWMKATEKFSEFRWESSLRSWLIGISVNNCRQLLRRKDRQWIEFVEEGSVGVVAGVGMQIDMERALAALPTGSRTVLMLHDVEGFKHHEIAEQLGISAGTSKSQLHHARRALRRLLGEEPNSVIGDVTDARIR